MQRRIDILQLALYAMLEPFSVRKYKRSGSSMEKCSLCGNYWFEGYPTQHRIDCPVPDAWEALGPFTEQDALAAVERLEAKS
jgi:hypothetical protein